MAIGGTSQLSWWRLEVSSLLTVLSVARVSLWSLVAVFTSDTVLIIRVRGAAVNWTLWRATYPEFAIVSAQMLSKICRYRAAQTLTNCSGFLFASCWLLFGAVRAKCSLQGFGVIPSMSQSFTVLCCDYVFWDLNSLERPERSLSSYRSFELLKGYHSWFATFSCRALQLMDCSAQVRGRLESPIYSCPRGASLAKAVSAWVWSWWSCASSAELVMALTASY